MNKLILCILFITSLSAYDQIELDNIKYDMIPVLHEECMDHYEEYYCDCCACDECLKERENHDQEEKSDKKSS